MGCTCNTVSQPSEPIKHTTLHTEPTNQCCQSKCRWRKRTSHGQLILPYHHGPAENQGKNTSSLEEILHDFLPLLRETGMLRSTKISVKESMGSQSLRARHPARRRGPYIWKHLAPACTPGKSARESAPALLYIFNKISERTHTGKYHQQSSL